MSETTARHPVDRLTVAALSGESITSGSTAVPGLAARDCIDVRADADARRARGAFKKRLAAEVPDLLAYGRIKAPATEILMAAAERLSRSASAAERADIPRG